MHNRSGQALITTYFNGKNSKSDDAKSAKKAKTHSCKKRSRATDETPSLVKFFDINPDKRHKLIKKIAALQEQQEPATVGIAYRHDKNGAGALFDHQTLQLATDHPTAVLNIDNITRGFDTAIRELPTFLKYGIKLDATAFNFPPLMQPDNEKLGLIVIPGVSADSFKSADYKTRHAKEQDIIKAALQRGQPVLGICGGSWTLYQVYGGRIISVEGHNYRGGMPRLGKNDGIPANNKQVHGLALNPETTLLKAALGHQKVNGGKITVNSVHGYAPSQHNIPSQLIISATALPDSELAPANLPTTENTIEAFEAKYGTPVMGIQWHPEAYGKNTQHAQLLQYMTLAGQRYLNNRNVQHELVTNFPAILKNLKPQHKLGYKNSVIRHVSGHETSFTLFKLKKTLDVRHIDEAKHEIQVKETYFTHHAYEKIFTRRTI